ncbi:conserved hypothetical protein [Burkholderia cepacia]
METSPIALIQIPAVNSDKYPTVGLNPAQVVAVYSATNGQIGTEIELNARDPKTSDQFPDGQVRKIISPEPIAAVLAALAPFFIATPFVPVELMALTPTTPTDLHVNPNAIVAVRPQQNPQGHGHVWLSNGEELFVTAAALAALAALLVAPPSAIAAGKI